MNTQEVNLWDILFVNGELLPDDKDLGLAFTAFWVDIETREAGLSDDVRNLSDDDLIQYTSHMIKLFSEKESQSARWMPIEKVLHKIGAGDVKNAGRILREYMTEAAIAQKCITMAINISSQKKGFGNKGLEVQKIGSNKKAEKIKKSRDAILFKRNKTPSQRELARLVSVDTGYSFGTVRGHLRKLE